MKICVRDAFSSSTYVKEYNLEFACDEFADLPQDAQTQLVKANVVISSENGTVTCTINISAVFQTFCSRCLETIKLPFDVTVKKLVRREEAEDFEDVIYVDNGYFFDITEEIRTQLYFEFPAKPLCKEDCKGLCPVCGCNLNNTTCSCDIRTTDPRLAVLKKLIDK